MINKARFCGFCGADRIEVYDKGVRQDSDGYTEYIYRAKCRACFVVQVIIGIRESK